MSAYKVDIYTSESDEPIEFDDVEFVSLVNEGTYGIPPVFKEESSLRPGTSVLYINTTASDLIAFSMEKLV